MAEQWLKSLKVGDQFKYKDKTIIITQEAHKPANRWPMSVRYTQPFLKHGRLIRLVNEKLEIRWNAHYAYRFFDYTLVEPIPSTKENLT
jgi:hypothetical protein